MLICSLQCTSSSSNLLTSGKKKIIGKIGKIISRFPETWKIEPGMKKARDIG